MRSLFFLARSCCLLNRSGLDRQPSFCSTLALPRRWVARASILTSNLPSRRTRLPSSSHLPLSLSSASCFIVPVHIHLLIRPTLIRWVDEIAKHAPSLKVLVYQGYKSHPPYDIGRSSGKPKPRPRPKASSSKSKVNDSDDDMEDVREDRTGEGEAEWWAHVERFDVVLTTYASVLSSACFVRGLTNFCDPRTLVKDFAVVNAMVARPRRGGVDYKEISRPRSPLVMSEWHRVVM